MLGKERDQVGRKGPYFRAQRVFLKIKEYNRYNSDESHTTHTHISILGAMLVAGVHSAGVDLDAAVQVRWLRDADRMEIQKCDRLTYILTRVGARDGCASRCGPVGPYFRD